MNKICAVKSIENGDAILMQAIDTSQLNRVEHVKIVIESLNV